MGPALYYWRATRRRSRRTVLAVVLVCGLLGTVALGALAGARRTDMAYGRYLRAINSSDVFVNVPGPVLPAIRQVERLPGVASAAATVGLSANPIVNGKVNDAWLTHGLTGSLDGDGFRQDRMTVLAGRLPRQSATGEIALTLVVGAACAGRRVIVEVASIEVKGDRLRGEMMGAAAADWLLIGPEGTVTPDIRAALRTDDGAIIFMQYNGKITGDWSQGPQLTCVGRCHPARSGQAGSMSRG